MKKSTKKGLSKAAKVIASLEKAAKEEEEQQKRGRRYRLLAQDIEFCVYMIENHGDDYEVSFFLGSCVRIPGDFGS